MSPKKYVLTGGTGAGKTSLIEELKNSGYEATDEEAREIVEKSGIKKFYAKYPEKFFNQTLDKYLLNYNKTENGLFFFDRGFPDILAMIDTLPYIYSRKHVSNKRALELSKRYRYDKVFLLDLLPHYNPEKHEGVTPFQRIILHKNIIRRYEQLGYDLIRVPIYFYDEQASIGARIDQILNEIK